MAQGLSVALPLALGKEDGPYALHKNVGSVAKQHIKMIVLTSPGERVMDPNFGVGIRNYLFEPATPVLETKIKNSIKQQVDTYLPFVKLLNVGIKIDPDIGSLFLKIRYTVPGSSAVSDLTIPVAA